MIAVSVPGRASASGRFEFTPRSPTPAGPVTSAPYLSWCHQPKTSGERSESHFHPPGARARSRRRHPGPLGLRGAATTAPARAPAPTAAGLSGTLNGGGSSAQESAQSAWRAGFQSANGDGVTVNYDPVGSGTGRENFLSEAYIFAGSDSALSDDEGELDKATERCGGTPAIEVPAYVSPIAVVYNLEGVDDLQLSAPVIAEIFDGKITKWNDPADRGRQPGRPAAVHHDHPRAPLGRLGHDRATSPTTWRRPAGGTWTYPHDGVWPIKGGEAGEGTSGLVAAVKAGDGTIGYADESQAGDLGVATIKVGEEYNAPTAEGAAKVLAESPRTEGRDAGRHGHRRGPRPRPSSAPTR